MCCRRRGHPLLHRHGNEFEVVLHRHRIDLFRGGRCDQRRIRAVVLDVNVN